MLARHEPARRSRRRCTVRGGTAASWRTSATMTSCSNVDTKRVVRSRRTSTMSSGGLGSALRELVVVMRQRHRNRFSDDLADAAGWDHYLCRLLSQWGSRAKHGLRRRVPHLGPEHKPRKALPASASRVRHPPESFSRPRWRLGDVCRPGGRDWRSPPAASDEAASRIVVGPAAGDPPTAPHGSRSRELRGSAKAADTDPWVFGDGPVLQLAGARRYPAACLAPSAPTRARRTLVGSQNGWRLLSRHGLRRCRELLRHTVNGCRPPAGRRRLSRAHDRAAVRTMTMRSTCGMRSSPWISGATYQNPSRRHASFMLALPEDADGPWVRAARAQPDRRCSSDLIESKQSPSGAKLALGEWPRSARRGDAGLHKRADAQTGPRASTSTSRERRTLNETAHARAPSRAFMISSPGVDQHAAAETRSLRQKRMSPAETPEQATAASQQSPAAARAQTVGGARFSFSALIARRIRCPQGLPGPPTPTNPVQRRPCSPPRGESAELLPAGRVAGSPGEADSWIVWVLALGRRSARATGLPTAGSRTPQVSR